MSILSDFQNIEKEPVALAILDLLLMTSVGMLAIFYFDKNLFLTLDTIKLILLAISITTPFIMPVFFSLALKLKNTFETFSVSIMLTSVSFFITLVITDIAKRKSLIFPLDMIALIILIFEMAIIIFIREETKRK